MPRRKRRLAARIRDWLRQLLAFLFSNVGVIVLVVVYTIAGAFMFQAIEGAGEMERENHMMRERDSTAQYLWQNVTLTLNLFNETELKRRIKLELQKYQGKVVVAVRRGWDGGKSSRQWSFSSAFLYSLTVITTIGYGHLSPRTNWGKVTTVLYALLGMPLFLLYLSNLGELLARWFKWLYALVCLCRGCPGLTRRRVARHRAQMELSEPESIERPAPYSDPVHRMPAEYYGPRRHEDYRRPDDHTLPRRPDDYTIPPYRRPNDVISPYQTPANYISSRRLGNYAPPYRRPEDYISYRRPDNHTTSYRRPDNYTSPRRPEDCAPPYRRAEEYISSRRPEDYALPYRRPEDYALPYRRPEGYAPPYRRPDYRSWTVPPSRWPPVDESPVTSEFSYITFDAQTITVPISVCVFIMVGYLLFGSMIFGKWEEWDQLDGAYFCFISLSSIGFGDFVPGERIYTARIETSFIVCSMYLMLGMALVAMCFNLMQEQVIHYFAGLKRALKRICRCCKR